MKILNIKNFALVLIISSPIYTLAEGYVNQYSIAQAKEMEKVFDYEKVVNVFPPQRVAECWKVYEELNIRAQDEDLKTLAKNGDYMMRGFIFMHEVNGRMPGDVQWINILNSYYLKAQKMNSREVAETVTNCSIDLKKAKR